MLQPQVTTNLLSVTMDLPSLGISYKWNYTICSFCDLLLSITFSKFIHVVVCISTSGLFFFFFSFFFFFLGPNPWHMEVPRLGVQSELRLPAYTTTKTAMRDLCAASATYTTDHGQHRILKNWVRPEIKISSSWILVGFITAESQQELLKTFYSWIIFHCMDIPYFIYLFINWWIFEFVLFVC